MIDGLAGECVGQILRLLYQVELPGIELGRLHFDLSLQYVVSMQFVEEALALLQVGGPTAAVDQNRLAFFTFLSIF